MRIIVDSTQCQGHNLCLSHLPELLEPDEHGYVTPVGDGFVPPAEVGAARTAAESCPEEAIRLDEETAT